MVRGLVTLAWNLIMYDQFSYASFKPMKHMLEHGNHIDGRPSLTIAVFTRVRNNPN